MATAAAKSLVRRLLVRVHPDVVASRSETYRAHNELALKSLLHSLDQKQQQQMKTQKIFFYLRDGGKTNTVLFDPFDPERGLRDLLGETELVEPLLEEEEGKEQDNVQEILRSSLSTWWATRELLIDDIDRLFRQNRVKFATNALEMSAEVEDEFELKEAVDLVKETLEFHVDDSTLKALQNPFCKHAEIIVVGKNLNTITREMTDTTPIATTLYVPLKSSPETLGKEIDDMVDEIIEKTLAKYQQS